MGAIRIFNGKRYRYNSRHALKKWAEVEANSQRARGKNARIVHFKNKPYPYEVFINP